MLLVVDQILSAIILEKYTFSNRSTFAVKANLILFSSPHIRSSFLSKYCVPLLIDFLIFEGAPVQMSYDITKH